MKNQLKIVVFATILFCLTTQISKAQISCTRQIDNNTTCTWVVDVSFYNGSCGTPCQTYTALTIGPNSSISPTCGSCSGPLCNVVVTFVSANSSALSGGNGFVDANNISDSGTSACSTGNYTADWNITTTIINP